MNEIYSSTTIVEVFDHLEFHYLLRDSMKMDHSYIKLIHQVLIGVGKPVLLVKIC